MIRYLSENPEYFDPETIDVMIRALDEAWERVEHSGARLDGQTKAARNALAQQIVDMARQGERDGQRLIEGATAPIPNRPKDGRRARRMGALMRSIDGSGLAAVHTADRNLRQAACSVGLDPSYWYPVEFDSALRREQITGVRFQDTSVALFRNRDGEVHAIEDRCAHRGVKLSQGFVEGCNLRCVYHGWTYAPDGKLCKIEHELFGKNFPSVKLRTFPVQVRYGLIWVFFGDPKLSKQRHVPEIPALESKQPWICIPKARVWKAHPAMIVNNFIDSTHVATLHNRNFWTRSLKVGAVSQCKVNSDHVFVRQEVEIDKNGFASVRRASPEDQHRGCLLRLSVSLGHSRRSVHALDFDVAARQTYHESVSAEFEQSRQNSLHSLACATVAAAIRHAVLLALSRRSIA
jgi:phenylpropionate dioxygenase-like ring-hydroxylating dioxygenase large terminal subunit